MKRNYYRVMDCAPVVTNVMIKIPLLWQQWCHCSWRVPLYWKKWVAHYINRSNRCQQVTCHQNIEYKNVLVAWIDVEFLSHQQCLQFATVSNHSQRQSFVLMQHHMIHRSHTEVTTYHHHLWTIKTWFSACSLTAIQLAPKDFKTLGCCMPLVLSTRVYLSHSTQHSGI